MEAERVRAQLQWILASSAFANAERGSKFLRFVVEAALEGRAGEIKEYVIGVEVKPESSWLCIYMKPWTTDSSPAFRCVTKTSKPQ
jgi:hypothetical protein